MREYTVTEKQRITKLAIVGVFIFFAGMFAGTFIQDEALVQQNIALHELVEQLRQMYIGCLGR